MTPFAKFGLPSAEHLPETPNMVETWHRIGRHAFVRSASLPHQLQVPSASAQRRILDTCAHTHTNQSPPHSTHIIQAHTAAARTPHTHLHVPPDSIVPSRMRLGLYRCGWRCQLSHRKDTAASRCLHTQGHASCLCDLCSRRETRPSVGLRRRRVRAHVGGNPY